MSSDVEFAKQEGVTTLNRITIPLFDKYRAQRLEDLRPVGFIGGQEQAGPEGNTQDTPCNKAGVVDHAQAQRLQLLW